jgi:signal transduction histidine kinase
VSETEEPSEPKSLDDVIDDFVSINDELARLSKASIELIASAEQLDGSRKDLAAATKEAAANYAAAIKDAEERIQQSIKVTKKTLADFLDELRQYSDDQRAASLEMLAGFRSSAGEALEAAQRDHRDTASALQHLIASLKDSGRDLADTAAAFRQLDPEAMQRQVETIREEAARIKREGRFAIASVIVTLGVLLVVLL